ncbi:acyl carrier protein [Streptomyces sp. ME19-01-6]|uniref:acyl carrier protein n=1 Tax=Streptomyces sp. ME19-01-6 TaxID=3028686 RepID=UPI0029AFA63C|nr:acyl carrier protein [Streptomyces sp. ME19-01-6]MDX3225360.1 acyl carrier protein [Streptomyces sp. ME19-01-6]
MTQSLTALISETLGIPPEKVTDDLGFQLAPEWDSVTHIELMLRLEEFLGVEIDGERVVELRTVGVIRAFARAVAH